MGNFTCISELEREYWTLTTSRDSIDNHLEKQQVLNGLIVKEDHSVVLDLHDLVTQHLFILIELYFHCKPTLSQQNRAQLIVLNSTNLK